MKTTRIIAAFCLYAALGFILGATFEGACISFAKGDLKLEQIADDEQPFKIILDSTLEAAKEVRFWILPVLIAAGLGAFWAHVESRDGTAFDFEKECRPWWETYRD